jgi:hypothetical protein
MNWFEPNVDCFWFHKKRHESTNYNCSCVSVFVSINLHLVLTLVPRHFQYLFLVLILSVNLHAQEVEGARRPWSYSLSPHYGFIVPHTKQMEHLIQGHSYGGHVYLYRKTYGNTFWQQAYNYPEQGLDLTFINTGNANQLGQQYVAGFLLNLPLNKGKNEALKSKRSYAHWLGLALGAGYTTRTWDLESNHQAAVIGSRSNISLGLQYSLRVARFGQAELRAGIRITHFSNGAFQLPNLGTNNAGVFLSYMHHSEKKSIEEKQPVPGYKKNTTSISSAIGLKEIPPPYGRKFLTSVTSFLQERRISYKSSFGLGMDVLYNTSLKVLMERKREERIPSKEVLQLGAVFSYSLHFNQFELKMQQGIYIRDNWKVDGLFYHRFGLRYHFTKHVFAQLTLKTHFAKADFGEWGLGYSF